MKKSAAIFFTALLISNPSLAFKCYFTLLKDSCFKDYEVTVNVHELESDQSILTVTVPEGEDYQQTTFDCSPSQVLAYDATFSPVFWAGDKGKVYMGKETTTLPPTIVPGATAWTVTVCFSGQFSSVPMPPSATSACQCDFTKVPAVGPLLKIKN